MGIFDTIRAVLGTSAETDATREADPEDLFGMSTAYMTMEADLGYDHCGEAALCFSGVDSTRFDDAVETVEAILEAGEIDTGTGFHRHEDDHGYQWFVLEDNDPEDLVTSIHFAADQFIEEGSAPACSRPSSDSSVTASTPTGSTRSGAVRTTRSHRKGRATGTSRSSSSS